MSPQYMEIKDAIASLGFPIVVCLALMFFIYKALESHKKAINRMSDTLDQLIIILSGGGLRPGAKYSKED